MAATTKSSPNKQLADHPETVCLSLAIFILLNDLISPTSPDGLKLRLRFQEKPRWPCLEGINTGEGISGAEG